jgi:hypothetical protein
VARACEFTVSGALHSWQKLGSETTLGEPTTLNEEKRSIAGVLLKAGKDNAAGGIFVGGQEDALFPLYPENTLECNIDDLSKVFVRFESDTDILYYVWIDA